MTRHSDHKHVNRSHFDSFSNVLKVLNQINFNASLILAYKPKHIQFNLQLLPEAKEVTHHWDTFL